MTLGSETLRDAGLRLGSAAAVSPAAFQGTGVCLGLRNGMQWVHFLRTLKGL